MSDEHKARIAAGNTKGQKQRWADPDKRARALAGCHKSWTTGSRAKDRVIWTTEMDAELTRVFAAYPWKDARYQAQRRCGVCDRLVVQRVKELGLSSLTARTPRPARIRTPRKPRAAPKLKTSTPSKLPQYSPEIIEAQQAADRYVTDLLTP